MEREKVIKTIDGCINDASFCNKCDYDGCVFQHGSCEKDLLADALELIKNSRLIHSEHALYTVYEKNGENLMDREKVIRDLRYLKSFGRVSGKPQITEIAESAIALLKEQDTVEHALDVLRKNGWKEE